MSLLSSNYIEDQYITKLINYKYSGGDNSILYRYVINPFCNKFVTYLPTWLAPNVITVSGFFFNLFNLILTTYYTGWKGGAPLPIWVCIACSISYTTYIIFDYTDGKQARRLKASSPLGLLVDHGTDACTTFFLNTWEEYYVGELVLPVINGVAEGTLVIDIINILSAIFGDKLFWKEFTFFEKYTLKVNDIMCLTTFIGGSFFSIMSLIGVYRKVKKDKKRDALKTSFIFVIFACSLISVSFLSNSIIVKEYPKFLILTFGFMFSKMLGLLQLSHILGSPYKIYQPVFMIPLLSLLIHSLIYYLFHYSILVSIDSLIISVFIWNFLSWAHFVYFCSDQICEILNIKRFSLGKRYPSRPSYDEIKAKLN